MSPASRPSVAEAYDLIADRWRDERFGSVDGVSQHRRALAFLEPGSEGWALAVGCGCSTRFNALLRERGLSIEGVDASARMIALARGADPSVELHRADVCDWPPPRRYRFVSAWDSIWHVPLERQRPLLLKLAGALEPRGVLVFTAGGLDGPSEHVDDAMGPAIYYATLGVAGVLEAIDAGGCVCRHLEFDQWPQRHLVVVAQRRG